MNKLLYRRCFSFLLILLLVITCKESKVETPSETLPDFLVSASQFPTGSIYFVNTKSGLHLRDKPSQGGKSLGLIPDGTRLSIEFDTSHEETISNTPGHWMKVLNAKTTGFVFSGFLSLMNEKKIREELEKEIHCEQHKSIPIEMSHMPTVYLFKDKSFGYLDNGSISEGVSGILGTYEKQGEDLILKGEKQTLTLYGVNSKYFLDIEHRDRFAKNPKIVEEIEAKAKANASNPDPDMGSMEEIVLCE